MTSIGMSGGNSKDFMQDKLEEVRMEYLDYRFEQVEKELNKIVDLLTKSTEEQANRTEQLNSDIKELRGVIEEKVNETLNEHDKKFLVIDTKVKHHEKWLSDIETETATSRQMFKNHVTAIVYITVVVIVVLFSLAAMDFSPIIKFLTLIK